MKEKLYHTYGHTVHAERLNWNSAPDEFERNLKDLYGPDLILWNVFNVNLHNGYFVVYLPQQMKATDTYHNYESFGDEVEAVTKVALQLFPASNIVTDPLEIEAWRNLHWVDKKAQAPDQDLTDPTPT